MTFDQESTIFVNYTADYSRGDYLKESSTKVVHTRFLMILGIQLCEQENRLLGPRSRENKTVNQTHKKSYIGKS